MLFAGSENKSSMLTSSTVDLENADDQQSAGQRENSKANDEAILEVGHICQTVFFFKYPPFHIAAIMAGM